MEPTLVTVDHFKGKLVRDVEIKGVNVIRFIFSDFTYVELETVPVMHLYGSSIHGFEATEGVITKP